MSLLYGHLTITISFIQDDTCTWLYEGEGLEQILYRNSAKCSELHHISIHLWVYNNLFAFTFYGVNDLLDLFSIEGPCSGCVSILASE